MSKLGPRQVDRSYHPRGGLGFSESLKRARKPFLIPNIIVGTVIAAFAAGIYSYSISAVKQDDFSDIDDLLPPIDQRKNIKSIEDEQREQAQPSAYDQALSPSALSRAIPGTGSSNTYTPTPAVSSDPILSQTRWGLPRRLDEIEWVKRRGWVESGRGNVLVWGAPNVDNVGSVEGTKRGPRLV